ncbi:squalene-associated FAD-dependent desaturase [Hydrogenophaga palleronii]|uniref:Squalene-associated FAD-dependent desaturase n=1 Tax=Hydrogenophaga palleronii TaxID=65655 RepID=A0ABU1WHF8_9BURK|nr:hydroxysqualene dehydroxylase HpnE [Hydrogenophaga palleronii]MDR7148522.1 squalene-associated FAD-dependent desaturase [Hydrogenophaga palleronii]
MKVAIVGAGWAGMAAAVTVAERGSEVTVFEAARTLGGRARAMAAQRPDGVPLTLDNGQHILIGAYTDSLALMERVGVNLAEALWAMPLALPYPDGQGLQTPRWAANWPAPLDALAAIATARGWSWSERLALVRTSLAWRAAGFRCPPSTTVSELCARLPRRVMAELIEPLCVSALNTPASQSSAQVFLRVMRDALFGKGHGSMGASNLLLPRVDLSMAFPQTAQRWLGLHHPKTTCVHAGTRVIALHPASDGWVLQVERQGALSEERFDQVIWATAATPAAQAMRRAADEAQARSLHGNVAQQLRAWASVTQALNFTAITTVYAWSEGVHLPAPLLALRAEPDAHSAPAQFVFDRGQLQPNEPGNHGVLAFVVSASVGDRDDLQSRVLQQAARQLGLDSLQPIQTVVEKRATFACTPELQRPPLCIAPALWAAGDYVEGPYPATLEGAVRSGVAVAQAL